MRKRKASLDMAMGASTASQKAVGTQDVPAELLDEIIDKSSFGAGAKTSTVEPTLLQTAVVTQTVETGEHVVLDGTAYPLNTEILIDSCHIVAEFKGNTRNNRILKNIDELAMAIIPAGYNTEPVKARPMKDGSGLELIKGKRRTAAVKRANEMSADEISLRIIISNLDDIEATKEAAMENVGKENLSPWELADQLQELLDSRAVERVVDLAPYLPADKKDASRTTIQTYLEPARLPPEVRAFIDEGKATKNSAITKLSRRLGLIKGMEKAAFSDMAKSFLKGKQEVLDIVHYLDGNYGSSKSKQVPTVKCIQNSEGDAIATLKQKTNGGVTIDFEKIVTRESVEEMLQFIEEKLSNLQPSE